MFDDVVRVVWFHIQVHWFVVFFSERLVDMFQQIEFNVQVVCHLGNWLNFDLQILTAKNYVQLLFEIFFGNGLYQLRTEVPPKIQRSIWELILMHLPSTKMLAQYLVEVLSTALNSLVAGLTSLKIWSTKSAKKRHLCASISAHGLHIFFQKWISVPLHLSPTLE